jgi:photosystem II stability/assembly factor-like uncharacterized protein
MPISATHYRLNRCFLKLKALSLSFGLILSGSCKSEVDKTKLESSTPTIEIFEVLEDTISIRAMDYHDTKIWYAGSHGKYGSLNIMTDSISEFQIEIENNLEFRSLAITKNFTYILTAGNPALIYKISHKTDSIQLVYTENGEGVFYDSMKFWNDNEGIAMGDPQHGCFSIIKTSDAGKTWQKTKCNQMPTAYEGEAAFAASNSNLSIRGNNVWFVTGGQNSRIFHSKDKGINWKAYNTPIISGEQMTGIYATDFFNEELGVIIGGDWNNKSLKEKNKAITHDGGQTWQLISEGSGPGYCSDIIFIPKTDGQELLAVGSPGIWWSKNEGKSWTKLSNKGFYTVSMINSNDGYLAGNKKLSRFKLSR